MTEAKANNQMTVTIDGTTTMVAQGSTILAAARGCGVDIPTLCYLEGQMPHANCRMCVVEVEGKPGLVPACATPVRDGMRVITDSERIRSARKTTLELLLAHHAVDCHHCLRIGSSKCADLDPKFCEMCFFCDCVRDGFCELQALARAYGVDVLPFEERHYEFAVDGSAAALVRDPNKCIECRRCVDACRETSGIGVLRVDGAGDRIAVVPDGPTMAASSCVGCGRCVDVCPTGAVHMREHIDDVLEAAHRYDTTAVAVVDPLVPAQLERLFGVKEGSIDLGRVASALRKVGFSYVFDTTVGWRMVAQQMDEVLRARGTEADVAPVVFGLDRAAQRMLDGRVVMADVSVEHIASPERVACQAARNRVAQLRGIAQTDVTLVCFTVDNAICTEAPATAEMDTACGVRELYRMLLRTGGAPWRRAIEPLDHLDGEGAASEAPLMHALNGAPRTIEQGRSAVVPVGAHKVLAVSSLGQARGVFEHDATVLPGGVELTDVDAVAVRS